MEWYLRFGECPVNTSAINKNEWEGLRKGFMTSYIVVAARSPNYKLTPKAIEALKNG